VPDPSRLALLEVGQVLTQTIAEVKYRSSHHPCNSHKVQARSVHRVTLPARFITLTDAHDAVDARERTVESRPAGEVRHLRSHFSSWPIACCP